MPDLEDGLSLLAIAIVAVGVWGGRVWPSLIPRKSLLVGLGLGLLLGVAIPDLMRGWNDGVRSADADHAKAGAQH